MWCAALCFVVCVVFFKQKTAYEMRISDWSSDVGSSDLGARILVGGDVADALAAGLDRVHLDRRQLSEDVGRVLQLDPVILQVLARREMAIAAILFARDLGQLAKLARIERAIGNGAAPHIRTEASREGNESGDPWDSRG